MVMHCRKHKIHVQVYNIMTTVLERADFVPNAYDHILKVASEISEGLDEEEISPGQVLLAWLVQHGISVIPRTSRLSRLRENSAVSLSKIPEMSDEHVQTIARAVEAFVSGKDLEDQMKVKVTFHASNIHTM